MHILLWSGRAGASWASAFLIKMQDIRDDRRKSISQQEKMKRLVEIIIIIIIITNGGSFLEMSVVSTRVATLCTEALCLASLSTKWKVHSRVVISWSLPFLVFLWLKTVAMRLARLKGSSHHHHHHHRTRHDFIPPFDAFVSST